MRHTLLNKLTNSRKQYLLSLSARFLVSEHWIGQHRFPLCHCMFCSQTPSRVGLGPSFHSIGQIQCGAGEHVDLRSQRHAWWVAVLLSKCASNSFASKAVSPVTGFITPVGVHTDGLTTPGGHHLDSDSSPEMELWMMALVTSCMKHSS